MKLLRQSCFVLAFIAATSLAQSRSLAGDWQLHISVSGNESDVPCTFTLEEKQLAGTCKDFTQVKGTVDGQRVTWGMKGTHDGSPITLTFAGKLDKENRIAGSVMVEEYGVDGTFVARQ